MQRIAFYLWLFVYSSVITAELPAFPGALGFGANATGGRTGTIYFYDGGRI
jgi:hypothetical protein